MLHTKSILVISCIALSFFLLRHEAQAGYIIQRPLYLGLNAGLVGFWSFDGKDMSGVQAYDRSGNGNRGTLTGGPTRTAGRLGQALNFDGVDDEVALSNSTIPATTRFTITAWVKPNSFSNEKGFLSWWEAANSWGQGFGLVDNGLLFRLNNNVGGGTVFDIVSDTALIANQWTHVVAVLDGTAMRIYVNGVKDSASNEAYFSGGYAGSGSNVKIGVDAFGNYFNGPIDDVRIYNRVLSPDEIKRLYKIGATAKINTTLDGPQSGLVGWWTFDGKDMSGVQAYDRSGNGNFCTLTNGPLRATGKLGQGLNFDGSNDYVSCDPLDNNSTPLTVSAWVKLNSLPSFAAVFSISNSGSDTEQFALDYFDVAGEKKWEAMARTGDTAFHSARSATAPVIGAWVHLAAVFVSATERRIYVNGVLEGTNTDNITPVGQDKMDIGIFGDSTPNGQFPGIIDDVRLYNRVLTPDEIKRLYKIGGTVKLNTTLDGPQSGLVGWWTFDGNSMSGVQAYDRSGNGNRGILTNGPVRAAGKIGQGMQFDGAANYVNSNYAPNMATADSFSVSAWFKATSGALAGVVAGVADIGSADSIVQINLNANGTVIFSVRDTDTPSSTDAITSTDAYRDNRWHHVIGVYNSSESIMQLYIDGTQVVVGSITANSNGAKDFTGYPWYIGARNNRSTADSFLPGTIDDVRIYNRALSNDEIKRLYNIGR